MTLIKKPRYILEDKCTGCTTCVEYCPVKYPDQFNQEISDNKAIHVYFAQAIPLVTYIDESCLYLKEKKCRICESVCKNNAIDLKQMPEKEEISVGAVILSPGLEPFDPKVRAEYRYGEFQNVVTSMDYRAALMLHRALPRRDTACFRQEASHEGGLDPVRRLQTGASGGNSYCSAVCCTYTQKQVILTKDHHPECGVHDIP